MYHNPEVEFSISSENLRCPVGCCVVESIRPLYQGGHMTAEEVVQYGPRQTEPEDMTRPVRRSTKPRRQSSRLTGFGTNSITGFLLDSHLCQI